MSVVSIRHYSRTRRSSEWIQNMDGNVGNRKITYITDTTDIALVTT
jgi:hypothetical protein